MKKHSLAVFLIFSLLLLGGSNCLFGNGANMLKHPMTQPLNCQDTQAAYRLIKGNAPGLLYLKDEPVNLTFSFKKEKNLINKYALEIQGVHTRRANKAKTYVDPFGFPDILNLDGKPVLFPFEVKYGDQNESTFELKNLPVPNRYGTYCLILLKNGGKKKQDRIMLGSLARVIKPKANSRVENTPVFGEGQIFHGFTDPAEASKAYQRMGIRGVRCEISWRGPGEDGKYDWKEYDKLTSDLKAGGLQAMFTLGSVTSKRYGIVTDNKAIPAAVTPNWNGSPYGGQADWGCDPKYFPEYAAWVKEFAERYWEDGKGALWGFENFNEPWEGGGISGYARDCISYRDWQRYLAKAAHSVSKDIRVCAASSVMNTEDKFYSEGPDKDGKYEFDQYLDVFTDHYVSPNMSYGPMVAKKHGKFSIENETWLVISEYLMPQVMCQWMAAGERAVAPWHPKVLYQGVAGVKQKYHTPSTVPVATAAFNHFITGLRFEKLVFQDHLPWLFQFGKDADPNGVCVMFGQLLTRGGPTPQDNPKGRLWAQVDQVDGGTITVDNSDQALKFFDVAGNEIHQGEKQVKIKLDFMPAYIMSSQGPKLIAERIKQAVIKDKYPAEILPLDFTQRITDKDLKLRVKVANRLNRSIQGTLQVKTPEGMVLAKDNQEVSLKAGEMKTVEFAVKSVKADASNQYPMEFIFDTNAGKCAYQETLNCVVAVKGTKKIDGNLEDWKGIPGITLVGKNKKISQDELARKPWLRLLKELPKGAVVSDVKLAWDKDYIYLAAKVNDSTPQLDHTRLEGRDEDAYFHSAASDNEKPWKEWLEKNAKGQSFSQVPYIYKKKPYDSAHVGDVLQFAFNLKEGYADLEPATDVPYGFHAVPDTDYEFSAYLCRDGKSELWNYLAPGVPRIHDWPHQQRGKKTTGPVKGAKHVVKQDGNVRIYEIAIPRSCMPELELKEGSEFKFTFYVGNNKGAKVTYGEDKAVTKINGLTLHPYWKGSPSNEVTWKLVK